MFSTHLEYFRAVWGLRSQLVKALCCTERKDIETELSGERFAQKAKLGPGLSFQLTVHHTPVTTPDPGQQLLCHVTHQPRLPQYPAHSRYTHIC